MFNVEELACRNDFDVRFSLIADIGPDSVRFVPKANEACIMVCSFAGSRS